MVRMNAQTRIIVATAAALAAIDIGVRLFAPGTVVVRERIAPSDSMTVRALRLVDDNGNERAVLKCDENGEPGLLMYDKNGTERLQLDTFQNTPSLILMDKGEARRVYFGMDNDSGNGVYEVDGVTASPAQSQIDAVTIDTEEASVQTAAPAQTIAPVQTYTRIEVTKPTRSLPDGATITIR